MPPMLTLRPLPSRPSGPPALAEASFQPFGPLPDAPKSPEKPEEGERPYCGPWDYLDDWLSFQRGLITAFRSGAPPPADPAERLTCLLARTEATLEVGADLPLERFVRKNGLDLVDRLLLVALVCDALSPNSDGGLRMCDLTTAAGASTFEAQEIVRARIEDCGALRAAELLESDMDVSALKRYYRLAPRMRALLVRGQREDPLVGVNDTRALDLLCAKVGSLGCTLVATSACERHPGWYAALPDSRQWVAWGGPAREVRDILESLQNRPSHRFTKVAAEASLNEAERLLLAILVHACWSGATDVGAGIASAAIERVLGREVSPEHLTSAKCRLVFHELVEVSDERDPSLRSLWLTSEAAGRILVGAPAVRKAEVEAGGQDEGKSGLWVEVDPRKKLADLVLPPEQLEEVLAALENVRSSYLIFHDWGFGGASYCGDGSILLLEGPPGTGKTFAAEALAGELGVPLLRASVERLTSKWFGRTEKQIARLFAESLKQNAVLLLDEADSLLSARVETEQAHHARHVNILLQEVEAYTGILVLTTNRAGALDPALERRLTAHVRFEVPGPVEREQLWRKLLPYRAPTDGLPDYKGLAERYVLTGSEIRSACLAAARKAARRGDIEQVIRQADLEAAAKKARKREEQAVGFLRGSTARIGRESRIGLYAEVKS